ncbi:serine/threonine kinase [Aureococcus anophagefferens]|nr:serine/threonine kinase [Aureococcus anophagefferens]
MAYRFASIAACAASTALRSRCLEAKDDSGDDGRFTVFLDIDGVLNSAKTRAEGDAAFPDADTPARHAPDPAMVARLARAIRDGERRTGRGCRLVLSSTWRLRGDALEAAEAALGRAGLGVDAVTPDYSAAGTENLIDGLFNAMDTPNNVVPNEAAGDRVDEIFSVVNRLGLRKRGGVWIVVDDLNLPWRNPRLPRDRFVRTNDALGFTDDKADEAVAKLVCLHTGEPWEGCETWDAKWARSWDAAWALIDNGRGGDAVDDEVPGFAVPRRRLVRFGGDGADFKRSYRELREVGRGGYGRVSVATHAVTMQRRAVKRMTARHPSAHFWLRAPAGAAAWDAAWALVDNEDPDDGWDAYLGFLDNGRGGLRPEPPRPAKPPATVPAEVAALVELDHPHVVKLHEYYVADDGERSSVLILVMEYLGGGTLLERVAASGGGMDGAAAASALKAMLSAVVHGDLKPDNFCYDDDVVKLIDFGMSKDVEAEALETLQAGSLAYTAPETFDAGYGAPSDVWALGCMFFQMVTGELLIEGLCGGEVVTAFGGVKAHAAVREEATHREAATFEAVDADADGVLDADDLRRALAGRGVAAPDDLGDVVRACDVSKSGNLTLNEFTAATMSPRLFTREDLSEAAFAAMDGDGDGVISPADLERLLSDSPTRAAVARAVLAEVGADGGCDRARFDEVVRAASLTAGWRPAAS